MEPVSNGARTSMPLKWPCMPYASNLQNIKREQHNLWIWPNQPYAQKNYVQRKERYYDYWTDDDGTEN